MSTAYPRIIYRQKKLAKIIFSEKLDIDKGGCQNFDGKMQISGENVGGCQKIGDKISEIGWVGVFSAIFGKYTIRFLAEKY